MKKLDTALFICVTGHTLEHLKEYGHAQSMETVMLGDRIFDRAKKKRLVILDDTAKSDPEKRQAVWDKHLQSAFEAGRTLLE